MIHEIKCKPEYFGPLLSGAKTFEIRKADRDYRVTDSLLIKEYAPVLGYTGRFTYRRITHILRDFPAVDKSYVLLSLSV